MRELNSTAAANLNMTDFQVKSISQVTQFGEVSLDFRRMELCRAGRPVQITLREFKVLKYSSFPTKDCHIPATAHLFCMAQAQARQLPHG